MRAILAALALLASPALAADLSGPVRVVDGDSIVIAGTMIRLDGIDAPEWDQVCHRGEPPRSYRCGLAAKDALRDLIAGRPVDCDFQPAPDRYGRRLGTCSVAGTPINAWLVEHGHALAFVRYSDRYVAEEARARDAKRGMWAGPHLAPWDWRAIKRSDQR